MIVRPSLLAVATATLIALAPAVAKGQPTDFYQGKTVNIMVGTSAGGIFDISSRLLAKHMGRFIPGHPSIVVQSQPGAAGASLINRLDKTIERQGLTFASINRALPQLALVGDPSVPFDPLDLTWIGSLSSFATDAYMMAITAKTPAQSIKDLTGPNAQLLHLGSTGVGSTNGIFATLARDLLHLNIKVVGGYPGATEVWLGMDHGEVDGQFMEISALMLTRSQMWKSGQLKSLVAFGRTTRHPDYPDVPIGRELITDPDDLELVKFAEFPFFMAVPFAAPPGLPPDRVKILRTAFMATAADPEFLADVAKAGLIFSPIDGEAVHAVLAEGAKAPLAVRQRFAKLLQER
jgi:tripartite-type tricarboxylate transporter receptor subunit TctC